VVSTTPRPLYPHERPGTHCTGGWVGPRAALNMCEKSNPHRDSIPGTSSPSLYRLSYPAHISRQESRYCHYYYYYYHHHHHHHSLSAVTGAVSTANRLRAVTSRVQVPEQETYFIRLQNSQTGSGAHPTGHYMKNIKHICARLEDKSLDTCAPFIVCQRTAALSTHSLHPLQHTVTAAVSRDLIKKKYGGLGVRIAHVHVVWRLRTGGAE
jgi:hypothetical protein